MEVSVTVGLLLVMASISEAATGCECVMLTRCRNMIEAAYVKQLKEIGYSQADVDKDKKFEGLVDDCLVNKGYTKDECGVDFMIPYHKRTSTRRMPTMDPRLRSQMDPIQKLASDASEGQDMCYDFSCPDMSKRRRRMSGRVRRQVLPDTIVEFETQYEDCTTAADLILLSDAPSLASQVNNTNLGWWR